MLGIFRVVKGESHVTEPVRECARRGNVSYVSSSKDIDELSLLFNRPTPQRGFLPEFLHSGVLQQNWVISAYNPVRFARVRAECELSECVPKKHVSASCADNLPAPVLSRREFAKSVERLMGWLRWCHGVDVMAPISN